MASTKDKGDLGEGIILSDILRRGYKIAIPLGENWSYDLIVLRNEKLEKVQCKYTESKNGVIQVSCRSSNNWSVKRYSEKDIDWIACYDKTEDKCFYIPSSFLKEGRCLINLRVSAPKKQSKKESFVGKRLFKFLKTH